jgi:DNA polymerase III alpha subunit
VDFVHLHAHSHYSVDDGVAGVKELALRARQLGMRSLALTDHNTLAGIVQFCRACRDVGVRPIVGCELDFASFSARIAASTHFRLPLLVETELGYRNLVWLVTRACSNGRNGMPFLRHEDLTGRTGGLTALAGGEASELFHLIEASRLEDTEAHIQHLARLFGRDGVVFELQDFGHPKARQVNDRLYRLGDFLQMRCVATNNVHFLRPEDSVCMDFLRRDRAPTYLDFQGVRNPAHTRHLASADEMRTKFIKYTKAFYATNDIAERCQYQPNFDKRRFPVQDFVRGFDADSFLWDLTFREARVKFVELSAEIKNRLNQEFDYIKTERLSNNIMLLWDISQFCHRNKINPGVGRGNMISSLVAYILGITQINPLDYKLKFLGFDDLDSHERCLTVEVPQKHTRQLLEFLRETFGSDACSAIGKHQMAQRQAVAKEICAWFNFPLAKVDLDTAEPERNALGRLPDIESFFARKKDGVALPNAQVVHFMLSRLLPRPRGLTIVEHQFAISGENLNNLVPRVELDDELVTQMDAGSLDALNIPRINIEFDSVLNILDSATTWVRKEENAAFDPDRVPMDDEDTYDLLCRGLTNGIAPFNSITLKSLLRMHRPRNFMSLVKIKGMERNPGREQEADVREHVPDCQLTYRCAFIKAHYPLSFMAALLTHSFRQWKKFAVALREAKQLGLRILPPDINLSAFEFSQGHKAIRTGLMVVNGMGEKAYAELARVRKGGDFNDLLDLVRRTDSRLIHTRLLTNLVKAGALDGFGLNRAQTLKMIEDGIEQARDDGGGQGNLFEDTDDRGQFAAIEPPKVSEMPMSDLIRNEIAAAGYCISHDQLHLYSDLVKQCRALGPHELTPRMVGNEVHVAGFLDHVETDSPLVEDGEQVLLDLEGHVVSMPVKASKLYSHALGAHAPVMVGGVVQRRKDETYLKGLTAFTLRMVQQMSEQVVRLDLNLEGEDFRTVRLIRKLVGQYRGKGTTIAVQNFARHGLARWYLRGIEHTPVFFSPPFYYALKKILPEDRISLIATENADPDLLHALSPARFASPAASGRAEPTEDQSSVVDAY